MKIKKSLQILPLICVFSLSGCGGNASAASGENSSSSTSLASNEPGLPEGYKLSWAEEFDGNELDSNSWTPLIGNGSGGWGNSELEYYQSQNATVSDGLLHINAKKETVGNFNYTSARLVTRNKVSTTYGFITARIALPAQNAMWPAFWMLPENGSWPVAGEIDIMENKGSSPWTSSGALHHSASNGSHIYESSAHSFSKRYGEEDIQSFHTYSILWTEEDITWYVDGASFFTVPKRTWHPAGGATYTTNDDAPFNKPFHLLLNLAVGGIFDSEHPAPDANFTEAEMKVDYVRLYDAQ